jgi:HemY protein
MERLGQLIDSETDVVVPAITAAPPAAPAEKAIDIVADAPTGKPAATNGGEKDRAVAETAGEAETADQGVGLPHLPDDPGVAPEEEAGKTPRRFRLF